MVARQVRRSVVISNLRVGLLPMDSDRTPLGKGKDVLHGAARAVPLRQSVEQPCLETKTVDGQENPFIAVETTKFNEVQKYASNTRHAYSPLLVLVSKKFWNQLTVDECKILTDA